MRAFFEDPELGPGRIEITEEVHIQSQDTRAFKILEDAGFLLPEANTDSLKKWAEEWAGDEIV